MLNLDYRTVEMTGRSAGYTWAGKVRKGWRKQRRREGRREDINHSTVTVTAHEPSAFLMSSGWPTERVR